VSSGIAIAHAICADESGARPHPHPLYAVHVKSRFEFTTWAVLGERGYGTFLPSYRSRRAWSDRIKELEAQGFGFDLPRES